MLAGLLLGEHFDHIGLLMAERYFIAHQFVFHGILQGRVQKHLYLLALDESHLDDALTEATMAMYLYDYAAFACLQF